jgi:sucrose-6-phosphate hydrolase SacC (GH32 family)
MFSWAKLGRVFNPEEHREIEFIYEFAQAPSVIIYDKFIRVYFSCRPKPDINGQYVSYTAFVDFNRFNLHEIINIAKKPILELGESGTFDEFGIYPVSVIKNADEYLAYYAGWTRCESVPYNTSIGLAKSKDGVNFARVGSGPILSFSVNEPMTISGPKIRFFNEEWYLFYVAGERWIQGINKPESVFKIKMAKSSDGINWVRHGKNLIEFRLEENECQASPDVIFKNGKYHMFFSYKYSYDFRNMERGYRIGYATSTDLINWKRNDDKSGITLSESGWDSEMISYPHVFELDGNIYMLYLGNGVGKVGFGLAKLDGELN